MCNFMCNFMFITLTFFLEVDKAFYFILFTFIYYKVNLCDIKLLQTD